MENISELLNVELKKRQELNPCFSLRAFAKFLDLSPATLSQVISEKRNLSRKAQDKVLTKLGLQYDNPIKSVKKVKDHLTLDERTFELISNWHYFAILNLAELETCKADPRWIAQQLSISVEQANRSFSLLRNLGIIEILDNGKFRRLSPPIKTTDEIPSAAIRNYHQGLLKVAQLKIEEVAPQEREFRSITFAGNSRKLNKAKEIIKQLKDLVEESMDSETKDHVYQFSIQLFPISKGEKQ